MTGKLTEKNGYWYIILNMVDSSGEKKRKWISTGLKTKGTKKEATELLNRTIKDYENTEYTSSYKSEFYSYVLDWLKVHQSSIQTTTYNGYRYIVDKYIVPYFKGKNINLTKLKPMDIQRYYMYLQQNTTLSSNSIRKHHQVLHRCLADAYKNRLVTENVCDYVDKPKQTYTEHTFLEENDLTQLIECIKGHKLETTVLFAIYYGLRRSEILGLTWDCIDFNNDTIKIRKKVVRTFDENHKLSIEISNDLKTYASYREFPLIPEIKENLITLKKKIQANKDFLGNQYSKEYEDFICVNEKGVLLNPDYVSSTFKKIVKKNNLPKSSFHSLRHSCGSLLLAKGYNIKEIQQWLGHSNYQTTSNIYAHTQQDFKLDIGNTLSGSFS